MMFWNLPASSSVALIDASLSHSLSYLELQQSVSELKRLLPSRERKTLGIVLCENSIDSIVAYLSALQLGHAVILLDAKLEPTLLRNIIKSYQPDWCFAPKSCDLAIQQESNDINTFLSSQLVYWEQENSSRIHPDCAILLSTSGSTGSPKMVRLSYANLQANADSITQYLPMNELDVAITTLPMSYAYGLSIINSHLLKGASIALTQESVTTRAFWEACHLYQITSLSGVPYTYQLLQQVGFEKRVPASLKYLTQAGGRLADKSINKINAIANENKWEFYVMYGQTEATARMSFVPPKALSSKVGSIGIAIPGGKFSIDPQSSELIYTGPNVMMGYAHDRLDLSLGDEQITVLKTGDIATQDENGYFYLKGRKKRIIKLYGLRVQLDSVEQELERKFNIVCAAGGTDNQLRIYLENKLISDVVKQYLTEKYHFHPSSFNVLVVNELPRHHQGKVDYSKLKNLEAV